MERYIRFIVRHRVAVVVTVLVLSAFFGSQLRNVHLEIRRQANLPQEHPFVQIQNRISALFGGEAVVVIGVVASPTTANSPGSRPALRRFTSAGNSFRFARSPDAPNRTRMQAGAGWPRRTPLWFFDMRGTREPMSSV